AARPDEVAQEVEDLIGIDATDVLQISAKSGIGVQDVLEAVVTRVPPPKGERDAPLQALVFASHYDVYKGVVAYVRVVNGRVNKQTALRLFATGATFDPVELGVFSPAMVPVDTLEAGEVGYIATGLKSVR